MAEDPLALETRRRIYDVVVASPGLSAREVQRAAGTAWGETTYHLQKLEDGHHVHRERGAHQDFFFASDVPLGKRTLLRIGRSRAARRILVVLLEEPDLTLEEIAREAALSVPRISVHLRRLLELGVVEVRRRERWRTFRITDRSRVGEILTEQSAVYQDTYVDRLVNTWSELFPP